MELDLKEDVLLIYCFGIGLHLFNNRHLIILLTYCCLFKHLIKLFNLEIAYFTFFLVELELLGLDGSGSLCNTGSCARMPRVSVNGSRGPPADRLTDHRIPCHIGSKPENRLAELSP